MPKVIIGLVIILSLQSCTLFFISYFRNLSDETVVLFYPHKDITGFNNKNYLHYQKDILKINRHTYKHLKDSLEIKYTKSGVFLVVPGKSTVAFHFYNFVEESDSAFIIDYIDFNRDVPVFTILDTITASDFNHKSHLPRTYQKYDYAK